MKPHGFARCSETTVLRLAAPRTVPSRADRYNARWKLASAQRFGRESTPMRVAVVGLGNAGYTLHLPALAAIESVSVVGGCDVDPSRRERAARAFRIPVFDDFATMLSRASPDLV